MECVFCKIIKKELPAYIVYEDDVAIAFLDINPVSEGHILVVPKKHVTRLTEMSEEELTEFMKRVQKVAKMVEEKLTKDYNIIINQGSKAGQIIQHLHIHIIPRHTGEEKVFLWVTHKLTEEEAKKVLEKLSQ